MYDFDLVSTVFGICFGVVPTVIFMILAALSDDRRRKKEEE